MSDTEKAVDFVLDLLVKKKLQAGHYIDCRWFIIPLHQADLIVQQNFEQVCQKMFDDGLFEHKEGHRDTLFLTKAGEEALKEYIRKKDRAMKDYGNININVSPTMNQTQSLSSNITQTIDIQKTLKENVDEQTFNTIKDIMQSSLSQDEKTSKIKEIVDKLDFKLIASLLVSLVVGAWQ